MMFQLKRITGYIIGFCLFYAPVALFQRSLQYLLTGKWQPMTIHSLCLRIPTEHLIDGNFFYYSRISVLSTILLLIVAFFLGPLFCGKLCPAGAFTEYLSKLVPERLQINWSNYVEIAPLRYGMLAGYVLAPFFGVALACSYCNYFLFDLFANYYIHGYFISLTSSLILTAFLWAIVFGIFTKGGRGYCNFMCPVGAVQNLFHYLGSRLGFTLRMQINQEKCIGCGRCKKRCPMEAIYDEAGRPKISVHNCIICGCCAKGCPMQAITYGRKP